MSNNKAPGKGCMIPLMMVIGFIGGVAFGGVAGGLIGIFLGLVVGFNAGDDNERSNKS
jgi:hypothetical protein